jgi:hypothetical protein
MESYIVYNRESGEILEGFVRATVLGIVASNPEYRLENDICIERAFYNTAYDFIDGGDGANISDLWQEDGEGTTNLWCNFEDED